MNLTLETFMVDKAKCFGRKRVISAHERLIEALGSFLPSREISKA